MGVTTILIVEDDDLVLETTKELLEVTGYNVLCAADGAQALTMVKKEHDSPIGLLLLDLSLPDINGIELLPLIHAVLPSLKTIICSGSIGDEEMDNHLEIPGVSGFLQKPFNLQTLQATIASVLE